MQAPEVPDYLAPHVTALVEFQAKSAHDRWLASTGQATEMPTGRDTAAVFEPLTDGTLARTALAHGDRGRAREFVVWFFHAQLAGATRRLRASQAGTTATVGGRTLSQSQLVAGTRSTTGEEHAEMARALRTVNEQLREERRRWLTSYAAARQRLGFPDHGALVRAFHPEVDDWVADAARWLNRTRPAYLAEWRRWREVDGIEEPRLPDARLLAAGVRPPPTAPPALSAVRHTVSSWGFGAESAAVLVDDATRPGKVGFAFCTAVRPPHDVRISVVDGKTVAHHTTLLHEFGHALHFTAGVNHPADLWNASPAMSEAFGFALELVVRRPDWQRRHLGADLAGDDVARLRFARESVRRTVAASLCFEMTVHDGHPDPDAEYTRVFSREFDVDVDGGTAFDRLQTYLEGQPCYPLIYHQAFRIRNRLWARLCDEGGPGWYLGHQARGALGALFPLLTTTTPQNWLTGSP